MRRQQHNGQLATTTSPPCVTSSHTWCLIIVTIFTIICTLQNNLRPVSCRPNNLLEQQHQQDNNFVRRLSSQPQIYLSSSPPNSPSSKDPAECKVYNEYGRNYLTPIDLVVKNNETNVVCIRARFSIQIRVEEAKMVGPASANAIDQQTHKTHTHRPIVGYVPLEHVLSIEESCPDSFMKTKQTTQGGGGGDNEKKKAPPDDLESAKEKPTGPGGTGDNTNNEKDEKKGDAAAAATAEEGSEVKAQAKEKDNNEDELELIVTFECGKLAFTFKRDESKVYVSAIRGMVKLDKKMVREFIAIRPMFLTSDLSHHFKYDNEIEVVSEVQSGAFILTAMFYDTEIEAFGDSTGRDFVKPPDDKSKPFPDGTEDNP